MNCSEILWIKEDSFLQTDEVDWLNDFNGILNYLGLFYSYMFRNWV